MTDGNVVDDDEIRSDINELGTHRIRELAIDRWDSTQLQTYGHVTPTMQREAAMTMEAMLSR
jgi:hypothetical protein